MCGIVGIITKANNGFTHHQADLFEEMLVCDAVRGIDSTGMFGVNKTGNADWIKLASHPFNLLKSNEYKDWRKNVWTDGKFAVGHNRKATTGSITNENAHPFVFGPILLVHNGYIENFRSLVNIRERNKHNINVDSHAIALLLARNEPEKILPELRGAFVFMWYNATEKRLHLIRNSERPLAMVETSEGSYYASEKGMLRWLLKRRSNTTTLSELKPGVLVSINVDGKSEAKDIKLYDNKPIVVSQPARHSSHHSPVVCDEDGVIQGPAQRSVIHLPAKPFSEYKGNTVVMDFEDSFNIHYGYDQNIDLGEHIAGKPVVWPQIIFSADDFKKISEDHVEPPVWKLWGPALDSKRIHVACQFRGTDEEVEELAYATHLIGHITRVGERNFGNERGQFVTCTMPRKINLVTTPNALPITDAHLEYIKEHCKCICNGIAVDNLPDDEIMYLRNGFQTKVACKWCLADADCKRLCEKPGQCGVCQKAKELAEKIKDTTVQAG